MNLFGRLLVGTFWLLAEAAAAPQASPGQPRLYNPYERLKNGPPLTNVFHKIEPSWIFTKLRNPKYHPAARMPEFRLSVEETLDIMAYLKSLAGEPLPKVSWPAWAHKGSEEMDEAELDAMLQVVEQGKAVWNSARCSICHTVNGPGGRLIGGFVDLRVGGIDLQITGQKLKRDWLRAWIKEPKDYFPETLMPRYRFSDAELKALVEYILRDDAFQPPTEPETPQNWNALEEPERVSRGRRLIELSRCVLCHDIKGIPELLPQPELPTPPATGTMEFLAYDVRCLSCHSLQGRGGSYAPDLTSAGSRIRQSWIAQFVASPDTIRPLLQQMPKFNLAAEEARIISSYLSQQLRDARIPTDIPGSPTSLDEIQRGRELFRSKGCLSCHRAGEGAGGSVGPDLSLVADRLWPGYIWFHLKTPHVVNPYSAEPDYGLSDQDVRSLAAYLATRKK